ncbi:MAG: MBOAT family O-acyltransferase [Lachnospiraceae bacterium]
MVFSSILFLFQFLPVVLILYFICGKLIHSVQAKNMVLFITSLFFYAWGEPIYVLLMIFSTLVDFYHGGKVEKYMEQGNKNRAKMHVMWSVMINLALLGFFKYTDFFIAIINQVTKADLPLLNLPLPIGISFYTFQTMSYTIDIYRGEAKAQKNMISFGTYVALFPQLIAGPIVRYQTIAAELENRKVTWEGLASGVRIFIIGLGKKVLIANNVGLLWDNVKTMGNSQISVLTAWLGILAYFFQIYFDFSGYSDMAIGLGRMFGFHFPDNFNYPYMSKSITEFWRRWHISLGTWFREYVYIPLGGNKKGPVKQVRNILIVWILTGIWHGANWNFLLWGLYFGVLLLLEKFVWGKMLEKIPVFFRHCYAIFCVIIGWVLFAFDSLNQGVEYLQILFGSGGVAGINSEFPYLLMTNVLLLLIAAIASTDLPKKFVRGFHLEKYEILFMAAVFILSVAYLVDATYNPFLYFRF